MSLELDRNGRRPMSDRRRQPYSFNNVADIRNLQQYCSIQHYQSGRAKVYDSYIVFSLLVCFFCFIVRFSCTTFAFVPLIIGRQLVELYVFLATCH